MPLAAFFLLLLRWSFSRSAPGLSRVGAAGAFRGDVPGGRGVVLVVRPRRRRGPQFPVDIRWIATPEIHFHIAADGVSLWLALLFRFPHAHLGVFASLLALDSAPSQGVLRPSCCCSSSVDRVFLRRICSVF